MSTSAFGVEHEYYIEKFSLATPVKAVKSAFTSSPTAAKVMSNPKVQEFGAKVGGSNVGRGFLSQMKTQGSAIPKGAQQFAGAAPGGFRGATGVGAAKAVKHVASNKNAYGAGAVGVAGGGYAAHKFGKSSAFGIDHEIEKSVGSVFRAVTRSRKPAITSPAPTGAPVTGPGIGGEPTAEKVKRATGSFMGGAKSGAAARTSQKANAKSLERLGVQNPTGQASLFTSNARSTARSGMNTQEKIGEHLTYNRAKYGVAAGAAGGAGLYGAGVQRQKRKTYA